MDELRTFDDTALEQALDELMQALEALEKTRETVRKDILRRELEQRPPPE